MRPFNPFASKPTPPESGQQRPHNPSTSSNNPRNFQSSGIAGSARQFVSSIEHDLEIPLDDFDRQLLAQATQGRQACATQNLPSTSLLRQDNIQPRLPAQSRFATDAHDDLPLLPISASSDIHLFSSPSVAVLKKRHKGQQLSGPKRSRNAFYGKLAEIRGQGTDDGEVDRDLTSLSKTPTSLGAAPIVRGIELILTTRLADKQRSIFNFPMFNAVQSKCFPTAYECDDNLVVSAPTGSGKTVIMELAILRIVDQLKSGKVKAVYQAPTKSLCSERYRDWQTKFAVFDIQCAELTGDTNSYSLRNVASAAIIVTTPEKWDSITRKWKDNAKLMDMIRLFLVDEVHILKDTRGATLEAIVSRMKSVGNNVRFIALSATIPNSEDIATWLTKNGQARHTPAIREVFDDTFRPVQLKKHVLGHDVTWNPWAFDRMLTEKMPEIVARYSERKPVIVFCATKESCQKTADKLAQSWHNAGHGQQAWNAPRKVATVENEQLQRMLEAGVAFHHAALGVADRKAVEDGFLRGDINIICSTSTLAVGINLPCYLVIMKGTQAYTDTGLQEYTSLEVIQMLGRAGRPQYETEACAVILCLNERLAKYQRMIAGEEVLESSLHQNLIEHLNAEIGVGTINSIQSAKEWLSSTFLNVRLQRNPNYYNITANEKSLSCDNTLLQLCEKDLSLLHDAKLVEVDGVLRCTEYGDAMARYCIRFETMKTFMNVPAKAKLSDVLAALSQAVEFRDVRMKQGERTLYKEINKAYEIRYPYSVDVTLPQHKASLVIQAKLGSVQLAKDGKNKINGGQLRQLQMDTSSIIGHAKRLIRCMVDIFVQRGDSLATKSALELARSLAAGVWDDTVMQLKQIPGIGDVFTRKLAAAGVKSIDILANTEPHRIEVILSKNPPFGLDLIKKLADYPMLHVSAREAGKQQKPKKGVEIKLQCTVGFLNESVPIKWNRKQYSILFLCETSLGSLVDFRRFSPSWLKDNEEILLTALIDQPGTQIRCHVMCDDIAGTHRFAELVVDCPVTWFPPQPRAPETTFQRSTLGGTLEADQSYEDFSGQDLDDSDLIAVAAQKSRSTTETVEVVEDIDEIMAEIENNRKVENSTKRALSWSAADEEHWKEPQRLPNGNWTCQHSCADQDKQCKHRCCIQGVKKKASLQTRKRVKTKESNPSNMENCAKKRKDSTKHSSQSGPLDKMLYKADTGIERGGTLVVSSKTTTALRDMQSSNQRSENSIASAPPTIKSTGDVDQYKSDNLYHLASDAFDASDYDWQAIDNIAAMFEEHTSRTAFSHMCQDHSQLAPHPSYASIENSLSSLGKGLVFSGDSAISQQIQTNDLVETENIMSDSAAHDPNAYQVDVQFVPSTDPAQVSRKSSSALTYTSTIRSDSLARRSSLQEDIFFPHNTAGIEETKDERQQRLCEEDQKRRWDELGPHDFVNWNNFGKYVRIVDNPEEEQ